jgi:hypothetical protein
MLLWSWLFILSPAVIAQDSTGILRSRRAAEILRSGFLDVSTNGQVGASARLLRIWIGDPDGFAIPVSIYSGVSAGTFPGQSAAAGGRSNDQLVNAFINPLTGLINFSFDGSFPGKATDQVTSGALTCQFGGRVLSGITPGPISDPQSGRPVNFFNSYGSAGFYFQTGAWNGDQLNNLGIFWISFRYISSYSSPEILRTLLTGMPTGFYHGWSIGGGVEISDLVNIKVIYYRYVEEPELPAVRPLCQFSFHYSL